MTTTYRQRQHAERKAAEQRAWLAKIDGCPFRTLSYAFERSVQQVAGAQGYNDARGVTEVSMRDFDEVCDNAAWKLRIGDWNCNFASFMAFYELATRAYGDDYYDQYLSENDPEY